MSLFRNENPILGPQTSLTELSGYGAGTPKSNIYKPTTREIISVNVDAVTFAAITGTLGLKWIY